MSTSPARVSRSGFRRDRSGAKGKPRGGVIVYPPLIDIGHFAPKYVRLTIAAVITFIMANRIASVKNVNNILTLLILYHDLNCTNKTTASLPFLKSCHMPMPTTLT